MTNWSDQLDSLEQLGLEESTRKAFLKHCDGNAAAAAQLLRQIAHELDPTEASYPPAATVGHSDAGAKDPKNMTQKELDAWMKSQTKAVFMEMMEEQSASKEQSPPKEDPLSPEEMKAMLKNAIHELRGVS